MSGSTRRGAPRDLKATLLEHGVALVRAGGPNAVSLRDVQRRAGVSNSAAYRHYADREALLVAIADYATSQMARTMEVEMARVAPMADRAAAARARFRATGSAYLHFAVLEPGLFSAAFMREAHSPEHERLTSAADGEMELGPFQLLEGCVDELVAAGVVAPQQRADTALAAWAAVHGLATLLLDGPMAHLSAAEQSDVTERLLDIVEAGIG